MIEEAQVRSIARGTANGLAKEVARDLAEQRAEFEVRLTALEARFASFERLLGVTDASAPADGAPAQH